MLQGIKIRIYPNEEQEVYISKLLGSCRFLYNKCLAHKIEIYNSTHKSVSFSDLGKYLTELKTREEYTWLKESHSKVLQQTLINLEYAYKSFFKNGIGFPTFKSKKEYKQTCRFPRDAIGKIKGNRINIINPLKSIHFKCSKKDEIYLNNNQDKIKSGSLTKTKSKKYYFSILIERDFDKFLSKTDKIIGIDLGIKTFIVDSEGNSYDNIKIRRNNEKKLKKLNKKLSKKENGSKNKEKCRVKLARFHQKLNDIKENYLHKLSNKLLNENQIIVMEDLNVKGMLKNHNLARSIQELSLNRFKTMLCYKSEWYHRDIIQIDRFFPSSKLCNICGHKNDKLTLNDRNWTCIKCKTCHNRDVNASINILNEGKRILNVGLNSPEYKPVDHLITDGMKQEKNVDK